MLTSASSWPFISPGRLTKPSAEALRMLVISVAAVSDLTDVCKLPPLGSKRSPSGRPASSPPVTSHSASLVGGRLICPRRGNCCSQLPSLHHQKIHRAPIRTTKRASVRARLTAQIRKPDMRHAQPSCPPRYALPHGVKQASSKISRPPGQRSNRKQWRYISPG